PLESYLRRRSLPVCLSYSGWIRFCASAPPRRQSEVEIRATTRSKHRTGHCTLVSSLSIARVPVASPRHPQPRDCWTREGPLQLLPGVNGQVDALTNGR